jgi:hypothetical protein
MSTPTQQITVKADVPWWHHLAIFVGLVASVATVYATYHMVKKASR